MFACWCACVVECSVFVWRRGAAVQQVFCLQAVMACECAVPCCAVVLESEAPTRSALGLWSGSSPAASAGAAGALLLFLWRSLRV